jgi:hypothetical protein
VPAARRPLVIVLVLVLVFVLRVIVLSSYSLPALSLPVPWQLAVHNHPRRRAPPSWRLVSTVCVFLHVHAIAVRPRLGPTARGQPVVSTCRCKRLAPGHTTTNSHSPAGHDYIAYTGTAMTDMSTVPQLPSRLTWEPEVIRCFDGAGGDAVSCSSRGPDLHHC